MRGINIYLNFNGNAEAAFNFYKSIFGGEYTAFTRFKDIPNEAKDKTETELEKMMHISLHLTNDIHLMATDSFESKGQIVTKGNNVYISLDCSSRDEADRFFRGLSENGNIEMPLQDTFWGAYFGIARDKFGIQWMFNFDK